MKKRYLFFAAILAAMSCATNVQAQTDVTSSYIFNADFETSPTGDAADNTIYNVSDWTESPAAGAVNYNKLGTVAYGASTAGLGTAPTNGSSVASSNTSLLGLKLHWDGTIKVSQTNTLPAGKYTLKFDIYVAQTILNANYECGVSFGGKNYYAPLPSAINTWYNGKSVTFILSEPTSVTFTFGCTKVGNQGGAASPIIFIDNVKLYDITSVFGDVTASNPLDFTGYITNPSFELTTFSGWTNSGFSIATNSPLYVKDGTRHIEKYAAPVATLANSSITQTITGLPNGKYVLSASGLARKNQNGTGPTDVAGGILFAGSASTLVSTAGTYSAEAIVTDGTLSIGFKVENAPSGTNWVSFDNFKLSYLGVEPTFVSAQSSVSFTVASTPSNATISLTGSNLTSDITITVPSTHITLSGDNVTGTSPNYTIAVANANILNTITATWDKAANVSGNISFTSGTATKTISVTTDDISNVALSGISLSAGGLTPSFAVGTTAYSIKAPADVNSVSITATTTPSVATVTNNGSSISASVPSVDLTGNSYDGNTHTSAYTVTWNGNYTFNDWAAGGTNTDAVLSIPTVYGWSANPTITWVAANSTQAGTVRYMDMVNGANTGIGGITYTYNGNNYGGRIMFVRWDGGNVARIYSYPVALETGLTYQFTGKAAYNSVDVAPTLTFAINSAKDNLAGTSVASNTVVTSTAGLLSDVAINSFTVPTTGIYYLNITSSTPSLCAIADLAIVGTPTSLDSNTSNLYVSSNKGQLTIHGTQAGNVVSVYNMSGVLINKFTATSNASTLNLKQGAYFVKVNNNVMKAIIK